MKGEKKNTFYIFKIYMKTIKTVTAVTYTQKKNKCQNLYT